MEKEGDIVQGRKGRGSVSDWAQEEGKEDTWERGQYRLPLAVMVPIPAPHLPQRTGDQGGQMESWQPGGWEGEDA